MENKKVLFITFDMSGYYDGVHDELKRRYQTVDYYNTAAIKFKYKNVFQKVSAFFYKLFTGKKLKNYYKYSQVINSIGGRKYDLTLVIRPDVFFDSQLETFKSNSNRFIAYYHDSINNIKRKKDVIHFFDKVYSYEKKDVADYNLQFISNFIYFDKPAGGPDSTVDGFSVMSNDYRVSTLKNLAAYFQKNNKTYEFFVMNDGKLLTDDLVTFIDKRMYNNQVVEHIKKARIVVDIHKYGVQDGLTFRVFEAMGFRKKLITTNKDIVNYDFYNPNNIVVIDENQEIDIPASFFETPYEDVPVEIYNKYTVAAWLDKVTG
ncbi:MAG: hypothetical protein EOO45_19795 [Flavobacterium sp.]|nr:MAG: hypothetical protein EOO45_19795 [Flavobacterium sp.]